MFGWRWKVDRKLKEDERLQQKLDTENQRQFERQRANEYNERLREFQRRFKCHICGKPSLRPDEKWESYSAGMDGDVSYKTEDWDKPVDLSRCSRCDNWTCPKHIHKGICQEDAERR